MATFTVHFSKNHLQVCPFYKVCCSVFCWQWLYSDGVKYNTETDVYSQVNKVPSLAWTSVWQQRLHTFILTIVFSITVPNVVPSYVFSHTLISCLICHLPSFCDSLSQSKMQKLKTTVILPVSCKTLRHNTNFCCTLSKVQSMRHHQYKLSINFLEH